MTQQNNSARKPFDRLVSPKTGACQYPQPDFVRGEWLEGKE
jgi:hypothetical protein